MAIADEPRPAITVRLDGPDQQLRAVLDLFRGSKAANPAAALAAWKRASAEPNRLGKPLEALIASFNPSMVGELRTLDGAEAAFWFGPDGGRLSWGASIPRDDGTFAALATALVLSGGEAEGPMDGLAVDRLGPPGSALMARGPQTLLIGGSREGLGGALARANRPRDQFADKRIRFAVEPHSLEGSDSLAIRRLRTLLGDSQGLITGSARVQGSSFLAEMGIPGSGPATGATVDLGWLDWVPDEGTMAAFAIAVDPRAESWDAIFRVADRVERVDPLRENVAPLRLRLDLLARPLGLRADADLLPHLQGVSGWFGSDGKAVDRVFLRFHLDDEAAAVRISERIRTFPNQGPAPAGQAEGRWLGRVDGRPVRLASFGPSVVLTWGEGAMESARRANNNPGRSAGRIFRGSKNIRGPACVGAIWPSRVPGLAPEDEPLGRALTMAPPVLWSGSWKAEGTFHFEWTWDDLDGLVGRFLDLIPLDPPPDR